jgi:hypothetical protein
MYKNYSASQKEVVTMVVVKEKVALQTMKAATIHKFGDLDVLGYEDIKTPTPKPGHKSMFP